MPDQRIALAQRAVALYVLDRERTTAELDRMVGLDAAEAVKALAVAGVVVRNGERVWPSPCALLLDELGLIGV
jgi:hypothetical protein